ncbi:MAG TPA: RNA 2',3'-cyclic phosphodiesterase [Candidatus Angelobacter sp.]|nr:RNA 2',3'-cyclic phosphodiesterase [Candidatus Angelobacter sp.]
MEDGGSKVEDGGERPKVFRLFVAISPPEAVKDEIEKAQKEMRGALPGNVVRWTKREQFHLTLKFLGNVAEARVAELVEALRGACLDFPPLLLRAERIGFFPNSRIPRVVWVWVADGKEILARLQKAIERAVGQFTEERDEKQFTGHVTLGRIPRLRRSEAELLAKIEREMAKRFFGEWTAGSVELIRSELSSGGSRYTTVAAFPLLGN